MSKIKWRQVTWYSKLLAAVIFIVFIFGAFYLGMRYQKILDDIGINRIVQAQTQVLSDDLINGTMPPKEVLRHFILLNLAVEQSERYRGIQF